MWETAIQDIFSANVIQGLFELIMAFVTTTVNLILYPFSVLIDQFMPDLNEALTALAGYFNYAGTYMSWVLNAFAVPPIVVTMIAAYYLFAYSTTFAVWSVKLIIKWKKALWA